MTLDQARLESDPARFLAERIKAHLLASPLNRLPDHGGGPIFDEPLVGFADGDDPIFQEYKNIIGDYHLTPREILASQVRPGPGAQTAKLEKVTVISVVLPLAGWVRASNRKMNDGPSAAWNAARWLGQTYADDLTANLTSILLEQGFAAVAPEKTPVFELLELPNGSSSTWSHRHAAYAAGLGTFSLSDALITPKGAAMRCCSVVTDLAVPATPRAFASHVANCPFFTDGSCSACIDRCPFGALSTTGHDKARCSDALHNAFKDWLQKPGYFGKYLACGLCQTKVPCESRIPVRAAGNQAT